MLTLVTGLAVDPDGKKIACYVVRAEDFYSFADANFKYTSTTGYSFVLDTSTGAVVSGLMKISRSAQPFITRSANMLLDNDGTVLI